MKTITKKQQEEMLNDCRTSRSLVTAIAKVFSFLGQFIGICLLPLALLESAIRRGLRCLKKKGRLKQ